MTQTVTFSSASSSFSTYSRIDIGRGSPSSADKSQIQAARFIVVGTHTGNASPADATLDVALMSAGKRVWAADIVVSGQQIQTDADRTATTGSGEQSSLCNTDIKKFSGGSTGSSIDDRGLLDLLGADVQNSADDENSSSFTWHVGCRDLGGYDSLTVYISPARSV